MELGNLQINDDNQTPNDQKFDPSIFRTTNDSDSAGKNPEKAAVVGTVQVDHSEVNQKHVFFLQGAHNESMYLPDGEKIVFMFGAIPGVSKPAYVTNIKGHIDYLNYCISRRHPVLHVMEGYETVTDAQLDPFSDVKEQAVKDFLKSEEFQKLLANARGVGTPANSTSESGPVKATSSKDISEAAAGSDGAANALPSFPSK